MVIWALHLFIIIKAILLGLALQHKLLEDLQKELELPSNQLLALLNKIIKKFIILVEECYTSENIFKSSNNDTIKEEKSN